MGDRESGTIKGSIISEDNIIPMDPTKNAPLVPRMSKPKVESIIITSLRPNIDDPSLQHLIPKNLTPEHCAIVISDVNTAVANGLRRTMMSELEVVAMTCEYSDISTDDPYIIPELIQKRISSIPIRQNIPRDSQFSLTFHNNSALIADVKTSNFTWGGKKLPFNETFTLVSLQPDKRITIKNVKLTQEHGYNPGCAYHTVAVHAVSIAEDVTPYNPFTGEGVPSGVADPRRWRLEFDTTGSMDPRDVIVKSCESITARVRSVVGVVGNSIVKAPNSTGGIHEYTMVVSGETHTIGNLFMMFILDLYPTIDAVTYNVSTTERKFALRMRTDGDVSDIISSSANHMIEVFDAIAKSQKLRKD